MSRVRAKDRRNPTDLHVERAIRPRTDAEVQRIRPELFGILGADLGEKREPARRPPGAGERQAEHPERVVLVVRVIEEPSAAGRTLWRHRIVLSAKCRGDLCGYCHLTVCQLERSAG